MGTCSFHPSDISLQCMKVSDGMCPRSTLYGEVGTYSFCSVTASELLLPGSIYFVKLGNSCFVLFLHVRLGNACVSCLQGNKMCNIIH